jgi:hypothetical protein
MIRAASFSQSPSRRSAAHHPAIRGDPPAAESRGQLLALNRWKRERQRRIVCG